MSALYDKWATHDRLGSYMRGGAHLKRNVERLKISTKEASRIANEIWGGVYLVRRVSGGFEVLLHSATGPRHLLDDFGIEVKRDHPFIGSRVKNNPTIQASLRGDRTKSPPTYTFRPLRLEEAKKWTGFDRPQLYFMDQTGRMANVRLNGKVKLWKRDPTRIEIPVKFGMYEAFRVTDPSQLYVLVSEYGNPRRVSPTPKEARTIRAMLRKKRGRGRRKRTVRVMRRSFQSNPMSRKEFEYMAAYIAAAQKEGQKQHVVSGMIALAIDLGKWSNPRFDEDRFLARIAQLTSSPEGVFKYVNRYTKNPMLHVVGANPPKGHDLGRVLEVKYKRDRGAHRGFYRHSFKTAARMYAQPDGSLKIC